MYISTSAQGTHKYIADVKCGIINNQKVCAFLDRLVEANGRVNDAYMVFVCDTYLYFPYGSPQMSAFAPPGSLMALAANKMC